mmetsp:Transcript_20756/g.30720  ORF Transcript_20756/g.30720 Transcript_20756/m.30720 type:complete len:190 (+) Transcript_20756:164-733(+)|eukprot:CAMPEP_0194205322 /NCGR_PEP_ID=MMETSP0156-20130528/4634_1 /TAXON_ID=33649 /ORGANISM="Thalassionema nitzschioides, Strain L26-B" /LENGTH=189 /DNA_ID=CAMNT_0038931569 /DNA_START=64 /DNA_END=633 /DNA_ORIENTATION=-
MAPLLLVNTAVYSCVVGFVAVVYVAVQHGEPPSPLPAQSAKDYAPVFYVTVASLLLLYIFLFNQSRTVFLELVRLQRAHREKKIEEKPTLAGLKYGNDNLQILAANRAAGNLMEQLIPFLPALYGYATFVSVSGAVTHGWLWVFFRSYYPNVFQKPFPTLFLSTLPAYTCIFSMMGITIYTIATSTSAV